MRRCLVLDSEALSVLAREDGDGFSQVVQALEAAERLNRPVVAPAAILAELYRGPRHNQVVDSCLSRESAIEIRDTDRELARYVGGILQGAGTGSEDLADAHVVAVAVEAGGGVVMTGDPDDINRLAAFHRHIQVHAI